MPPIRFLAKTNRRPGHGHPAVKWLKEGYLLNEGRGNPRTWNRYTTMTLDGTAWSRDRYVGNRSYLSFDGTDDDASFTLDLSATRVVTYWLVLRFPTYPSDKCVFEHSANTNTNAKGHAMFAGGGTGGDLALFAHNTGSADSTYNSAEYALTLFNDGKWHTVVCCFDTRTTSLPDLWSDGVYRTAARRPDTYDFASATFSNYTMYLGGRGGSSLWANQNIALFAVSFKRPSARDAMAFHRNPFGAPRRTAADMLGLVHVAAAPGGGTVPVFLHHYAQHAGAA